MRLRAVVAALLLALLGATVAAAEIEVIELRHRLAAELAPTLSAVAGEDVVVKAAGSRLIVRGSPAAIDRLRAVVRTLDVPLQSLRISVRRASDAAAGGAGIGIGREGVKVYATQSAEDGSLVQTVRVMEGSTAFIDTGESVPVTDRIVVLDDDGAAYAERRRYQHRPEGFYATARVVDGRAIVDIAVADSEAGTDGEVLHRRVVSTVSGQPGQWIPLGVVRESAERDESGIIYSTRSAESRTGRIEIRVEIVE